MHKLIFILIFLVSLFGMAQDTITYKYINDNSYIYYMEGNRKELKKITQLALKNNIDYYYLRMRNGIIYYDNNDYTTAIKHFKKALEFNSSDTLAQEYLYYCYVNTKNKKDALLLTKKFNKDLKNKLGIEDHLSFIDEIIFELGSNTNKDFDNLTSNSEIEMDTFLLKETVKDYFNYYLILNHPISKKISYTHAYTRITLNSLNQVKPPPPVPLPPAGAPVPDYTEFNSKYIQNQYYGNLGIRAFHCGHINFGLHYLSFRSADDESIRSRKEQQYSETSNDLTIFSSINKSFSKLNVALFLSRAKIEGQRYFQGTGTITYYPFGNLNLFGSFAATTQRSRDNYRETIINFKTGARVLTNLWVESAYTVGNIKNYLESNAFLIYNNSNTISSKIDINLLYQIPNSNLMLSLRSYFIQNIGDDVYTSLGGITHDFTTYSTIKYNTQTIIGGIKWNF
jgi:tetratricopeptide (TPR) repeat protein